MFSRLITQKEELAKLFKAHRVVKAYVFGSALTKEFRPDSDIDFLVKFADDLPPLTKGELWWQLHDDLRELLEREIDIVTENSLKNPYFIKELENTKKQIYGFEN